MTNPLFIAFKIFFQCFQLTTGCPHFSNIQYAQQPLSCFALGTGLFCQLANYIAAQPRWHVPCFTFCESGDKQWNKPSEMNVCVCYRCCCVSRSKKVLRNLRGECFFEVELDNKIWFYIELSWALITHYLRVAIHKVGTGYVAAHTSIKVIAVDWNSSKRWREHIKSSAAAPVPFNDGSLGFFFFFFKLCTWAINWFM